MSNVIEFLEKMGQDASLRHADIVQIKQAMTAACLSVEAQAAIAAGDHEQIESLLGAKHNVCAIVFPVEGDERSTNEKISVAH